jgi:cytochrome P450
LNAPLAAKTVMAMDPVIRRIASDCIESFRERGSCDFISEYSKILPIKLFMELVELPIGDVARLKFLADQVTRPDGTMTVPEVMGAFAEFLDPFLRERRENPGKDGLSTIAAGLINGEQIDYEEAMQLAIQLLIAGLDTIASFLGFMMLFLANNPAHRRQLIDDPNLIPAAADEFIRRFGIVQNIRTVAVDQTFNGVVMKEGDHVCIPNLLHGLDPDVYDDPMEVDFTREIHDHSFFGNGAHRCPGTFLTRTEVRITLEEWLDQIPEFEVEAGGDVVMKSGIVGSVVSLPLTWGAER